MDSVSSPLPALRINKLQFSQGNSSQHYPFRRGQILQGSITGKEGAQFLLEVQGQQFLADSKAPLQVGKKLELEVTGLTPQVTLRILTDPLTQNIAKSLHLLSSEGEFLSQTAGLAKMLPEEAISTSSQQTLLFFSGLTTDDTQRLALPSQTGQKLSFLLGNILSSLNPVTLREHLSELQNFTERLGQLLPQQHPAKIAIQNIREMLNRMDGDLPLQAIQGDGKIQPDNSQLNRLFQEIKNIQNIPTTTAGGGSLAETFLQRLLLEKDSLPPLLFDLLNITKEFLHDESAQQKRLPGGKDLQQFTNRLGTNMEQLLAIGNDKEAHQSLKSALLEISHVFSKNTAIQPQAEQLTDTIQLYQMLQIRLAGEALLFLPLPLSFLQQGYLLAEPDTPQKDTAKQSGEDNKNYSLHLKLEGLGNLQIDLQQQDNGMRVRFYAEDSIKTKFLSERREELQDWLTATSLESVQFLTGAEDPTKQLLARMSHGPASVLDTKA